MELFRGLEPLPFQKKGMESINNDRNVIISSGTGTGKTLISDYAIERCIKNNYEAVYTAPLKTTSYEKYLQLCEIYGKDSVGLITGDNVINRDAPIKLMTTEVLRNIMLENPNRLDKVKHITLDDCQCFGDSERGTALEEVIIFKPKHCKIIGLSATIPNVRELCDWMSNTFNEEVDCVINNEKIVEHKHSFFDYELGSCSKQQLIDKYSKDIENSRSTTHLDFAQYALKENLTPLLFIVFSKNKCERYAKELLQIENLNLIDEKEQLQIKEIIDKAEYKYPEICNTDTWNNLKVMMQKGIGYHHSRLIPCLKPIVEELFKKGLTKIQYATETYSMGVDDPVKTVCLTSHKKFDGKKYRILKPSEYLQIAGRAGRRFYDVGYVFTLSENNLPININTLPNINNILCEEVESQFKLSYNRVTNYASKFNREKVSEIFKKSLACFRYPNILDQHKRKLDEYEATGGRELQDRVRSKGCSGFGSENCPAREGFKPQIPESSPHDQVNQIKEEIKRLTAESQRKLPGKQLAKVREALRQAQVNLNKLSKATADSSKCSDKDIVKCKNAYTNFLQFQNRFKAKQEGFNQMVENSPEKLFEKEFDAKLAILQLLGYLDKQNVVSDLGNICAKVYTHEVLITEMYRHGLFTDLNENALNGLMASVVYENGHELTESNCYKDEINQIRSKIKSFSEMEQLKDEFIINTKIFPVVYDWSNGATLDELIQKYNIHEGEFASICKETIDLYKQIKDACWKNKQVVDKIKSCINKIDRDIVEIS